MQKCAKTVVPNLPRFIEVCFYIRKRQPRAWLALHTRDGRTKRTFFWVSEKLAPLLQHSVVNICIVGSAHATGKFVRIKPYSLLCKVTITCFLKGYIGLSVSVFVCGFVWENKSEVKARHGLWFSIRNFNHSPLFMGTVFYRERAHI